MYDILAVLVRALIITASWLRFFFFLTYCYFIFPRVLHFWVLDVSLVPPIPNLWNRTWRSCLLPPFVSLCVGTYKHTYTIRVSCIIDSRLNKTLLTTRRPLALSGSPCMLYFFPCGHAPSHFPHTLISRQNPTHAPTFACWLIDHFICKYTSAFNDSHLFLRFWFFFFFFTVTPRVVAHLLCVVQQPTPSPFNSRCVTCYGAI